MITYTQMILFIIHATLDLLRNVTVTTMIDGPTTITLSATTPI